jgi:MFS family permease
VFAQGVVSIGLTTLALLGSLIMYDFTRSATLAGLPSAIVALSVAGVGYPAGRLMDRRGRRPGLLLAFGIAVVGTAVITLSVEAHRFLTYLLGTVILSLGLGMGGLARAAVADMYPPERRAGAVGVVIAGGLLGGFVGPVLVAIGEPIAQAIGASHLAVPWALVLVWCVFAGLAIVRLVPDPREIAQRLDEYHPEVRSAPARAFEVEATAGHGGPSVGDIIAGRPAQAAMVALASAQATMIMVMSTASLMLSLHGHQMGVISLLTMGHILGMFGLAVPVGRLADRVGRGPVLVGGALMSASGGLLFTLGVRSALWAGVAFYMVGLGWCLAFVAGAALLGDLSTARTRARVLGTSDLFTYLAATVAALTSGVLLARGGEVTVGVIAAVVGSLPLLAILRAGRTLIGHGAEAPLPATGPSESLGQ